MFANDFIRQSGFRSFSLKRADSIVNASSTDVYQDILRNSPIFVFSYEPTVAKDYVYNIFSYLKYKSYPVFWDTDDIPQEFLNRTIKVVPIKCSEDKKQNANIIIYPGIDGKKALWKQIHSYVEAISSLNIAPKGCENPSFIILNPDNHKFLFNIAGFLAYFGISFSWYEQDATPNSIIIGGSSTSQNCIEIIGNTPDEQKKHIFNEMMTKKYLKLRDDKKGFMLGDYFNASK